MATVGMMRALKIVLKSVVYAGAVLIGAYWLSHELWNVPAGSATIGHIFVVAYVIPAATVGLLLAIVWVGIDDYRGKKSAERVVAQVLVGIIAGFVLVNIYDLLMS